MRKTKKNTIFIFLIAALVLISSVLFSACKRRSSNGPLYLSVMDDFKTEYFVGDELDPTGTLKVGYQTDYFGVTPITADMISGFDSSKQGDCVITITFAGKKEKVLIRILPLIATAISLDAETLPRVVYKGQAFPEGATLSATMVNGASRTGVPITAAMLGGFDSLKLGKQVVSVTYAGVTESFELTVEEDFISSVSLSGEKTEYSVGEPLFTDGVNLKFQYASGKTVLRAVTADMVSGFSTASGGTFHAVVSLSSYSCDYYYSVGKKAVSAVLVDNSLPRELEKGSSFPEGGVLKITYDDRTTADIPVSAAEIKGFDSSKAGSFEAEITAQGQTARYSYVILRSITQATAVGYTEAVPKGASFDGFGVFAIVYEDGESENIPLTDDRLTLTYSTSTVGETRQKVVYRGVESFFTVTVYDPEERNAVEEIELRGSFSPILAGEEPDVGGIMVFVRYKYLEATTVPLESSMIEFDSSAPLTGDYETRSVTVSLFGKTVESSVIVISAAYAARVTSIEVYGLPSVVLVGSEAEFPQAGLIAYYGGNYRTVSEIPLSSAGISNYDPSVPGEMTFTITYEGATYSAKVLVIAAEDKDKPTDAALLDFDPILFVGDSLTSESIAGARVALTLGYGYSEQTIALESSMISGGPFAEAGQKTVLFRYQGFEKSFPVTVHPVADKTEITAIFAEEIRSTVGVYPDLAKAPLTLEYGYGLRRVYIPLSSAGVEISPFSVDRVGVVRVDVTYKGKTCSALISFAAAGGEAVVERIEIDPSSVTAFEKGSALEGVVLSVSYASGESSHVNVTADMAPEFSTENSGDYAITIVYGGKSAVFAYTVRA